MGWAASGWLVRWRTVFFVRHNGWSVWFDSLGWSWPKYACFDDSGFGASLRLSLSTVDCPGTSSRIGMVPQTLDARYGESRRVEVRCADGPVVWGDFCTPPHHSAKPGDL